VCLSSLRHRGGTCPLLGSCLGRFKRSLTTNLCARTLTLRTPSPLACTGPAPVHPVSACPLSRSVCRPLNTHAHRALDARVCLHQPAATASKSERLLGHRIRRTIHLRSMSFLTQVCIVCSQDVQLRKHRLGSSNPLSPHTAHPESPRGGGDRPPQNDDGQTIRSGQEEEK